MIWQLMFQHNPHLPDQKNNYISDPVSSFHSLKNERSWIIPIFNETAIDIHINVFKYSLHLVIPKPILKKLPLTNT